MSRTLLRPYLVAKQPEGHFCITVRTTRLNSQGYPLVSSELLTENFKTATAARTYLRETYRAEPTDIATQAAAVIPA